MCAKGQNNPKTTEVHTYIMNLDTEFQSSRYNE